MYEYHSIYGGKAEGLEPTDDLLEAVKNADEFEVIVYDTEKKMNVYDIRNPKAKWNPRWVAMTIEERKNQEQGETE